jgi:hypothetical protein
MGTIPYLQAWIGPIYCPPRNGRAPIGALANLFEIEVREKFNRRHMVDIPGIKFFAQRRYRTNWPFMDGHYLTTWPDDVNRIGLWGLTFGGKTFQNGSSFY